MKTNNLLIGLGIAGAIAYFLFKKPSMKVSDASGFGGGGYPSISPQGFSTPEIFSFVEQVRAEGKSTADALNQFMEKTTTQETITENVAPVTKTVKNIAGTASGTYSAGARGTFTTTQPSNIGVRFTTGSGTTGYASPSVTAVRSVPKEQSIAYKLGYIK